MAEFIFVDAPYIVPMEFINDPKVVNNIVGLPRSWTDFRIGRYYPII
jgi:hypothetical protein